MSDTYETMRYWDRELTKAFEADDRKRISYCRLKFLAARETHLSAESVLLARARAEADHESFLDYCDEQERENPYPDMKSYLEAI